MKELNDQELIDLAYTEVKNIDLHSISQIVISVMLIVQAFFLIINIITLFAYGLIWIGLIILYLIHRKKIKNSEIKIQKILNELTSRNL